MTRKQSLLFSTIFFCLSGSIVAQAATYTVKAAGGGNYTSISACAAVAVAGDTCDVYTGSYSGWTQAVSGRSGAYITFQEHTGETATITSGVSLSSQSYIHITGFTFSSGGITGNGSTTHNIIDYNSFTTTGFTINNGLGNGGSENVIGHNTVTFPNHNNNAPGFKVYGDRNLLESNNISGGGGDCFDLGGTNVVVRNNNCHDIDGSISGEHLDFVQVIGGVSPTLSFSLIEGNIERNCLNDGGNCHFTMIRASSPDSADTNIVRFNFMQNMNGSGVIAIGGGTSDVVPNNRVYNNTIATESLAAQSFSCVVFNGGTNGAARNNICYDTTVGSTSYTPLWGSTGYSGNGDISITVGYSGGWGSPYSSEATYSTLRNVNPQFANYPTDGTLSAGSGALGTGVALTAVASGDSGSGPTLIVNDASYFQAYNYGTVQPDWIHVGTSTMVQIASVNYATNTITLANSISRSIGDPVYLYKDSDGTVVLTGSMPNVGAYGLPSSPTPTPPPSVTAAGH